MFFHLQSYYLFLGKSNNSEKSKSLATTNSKKANGVEASKGTVVKIVPSRKEHQVRKDSFLNAMEMFNSFDTFRLCLQVLLIPPIQELEKLADVPSKMAKLFLRAN